jgi:hypothetical protein
MAAQVRRHAAYAEVSCHAAGVEDADGVRCAEKTHRASARQTFLFLPV